MLSVELLLLLAVVSADELDDSELARRIREGDVSAFQAFFDRYHGLLYGYLRRRNVPGAVCEDFIQDAFIIVWEGRHRIDPNRSLRSYLFKIAFHRALNHFRDEAPVEMDVASEEADQQSESAAPDENAGASVVERRIRQAIAALPEKRRAVFELCYLDDLTYREAADVLGITTKTVENQMGRALKALRENLTPYYDEISE